MGVEKVSWWEKMPLWEKLILTTFLIIPASFFSCVFIYFISMQVYGSSRDLGNTLGWLACLSPLGVAGFVYYWVVSNHYQARSTPAPILQDLKKGGEFLLSSRAEYLGGHPLLSEIQVVGLGLTEKEVSVAAQAGTATIPLGDISEAMVVSERGPSLVAALGTTTASLLTRRILLPGISRTDKYLLIQYTDETAMKNNVIFGYIAPPHSHEEWRNKIIASRYKLLTGKTLDL